MGVALVVCGDDSPLKGVPIFYQQARPCFVKNLNGYGFIPWAIRICGNIPEGHG
jgi:hypothetical protein